MSSSPMRNSSSSSRFKVFEPWACSSIFRHLISLRFLSSSFIICTTHFSSAHIFIVVAQSNDLGPFIYTTSHLSYRLSTSVYNKISHIVTCTPSPTGLIHPFSILLWTSAATRRSIFFSSFILFLQLVYRTPTYDLVSHVLRSLHVLQN